MSNPTRVIIYTRVSTEEQAREGHSLEAQLDICANFVEQRGWEVVGHVTDDGVSGNTDARPEFRRIVVAVQSDQCDVVLTHKLDRFSRSIADILHYFAMFNEQGVAYASATEQFDFTTPFGKVVLAILAAFAEWYVDNLRQETQKGKRKRAEKGLYNGHPPFGYAKQEDGSLTIDKRAAEGVSKAFEKAATGGYTDSEVAALLHKDGHLTTLGRSWSKDALRKLLTNRFYLGEVPYRGYERIDRRTVRRTTQEWFIGQHPAIITNELFTKAQKQRRGRLGKHDRRRRKDYTDRVYLAAGMLFCEECGTRLRGHFIKDTRHYYDPGEREYSRKCSQIKHTAAAPIEETLAQAISNITLPTNWSASLKSRLQAGDPRKTEKRIRNLKAQLKRAKQLFGVGDFTDGEYGAEKSRIDAELLILQEPDKPDVLLAGELLDNFPELWERANNNERKRLLHAVLDKATIEDGQVVSITPKPEFGVLLRETPFADAVPTPVG